MGQKVLLYKYDEVSRLINLDSIDEAHQGE